MYPHILYVLLWNVCGLFSKSLLCSTLFNNYTNSSVFRYHTEYLVFVDPEKMFIQFMILSSYLSSSWPYLGEVGKLEIPRPQRTSSINASQVHFAKDLNTLYVIADYTLGSNIFHGISKIVDVNASLIPINFSPPHSKVYKGIIQILSYV